MILLDFFQSGHYLPPLPSPSPLPERITAVVERTNTALRAIRGPSDPAIQRIYDEACAAIIAAHVEEPWTDSNWHGALNTWHWTLEDISAPVQRWKIAMGRAAGRAQQLLLPNGVSFPLVHLQLPDGREVATLPQTLHDVMGYRGAPSNPTRAPTNCSPEAFEAITQLLTDDDFQPTPRLFAPRVLPELFQLGDDWDAPGLRTAAINCKPLPADRTQARAVVRDAIIPILKARGDMPLSSLVESWKIPPQAYLDPEALAEYLLALQEQVETREDLAALKAALGSIDDSTRAALRTHCASVLLLQSPIRLMALFQIANACQAKELQSALAARFTDLDALEPQQLSDLLRLALDSNSSALSTAIVALATWRFLKNPEAFQGQLRPLLEVAANDALEQTGLSEFLRFDRTNDPHNRAQLLLSTPEDVTTMTLEWCVVDLATVKAARPHMSRYNGAYNYYPPNLPPLLGARTNAEVLEMQKNMILFACQRRTTAWLDRALSPSPWDHASNVNVLEAHRRMQVALATKSDALDLSGLQLRTIPEVLGYWPGLRTLNLEHNELTSLPTSLADLTGCTISIGGNPLFPEKTRLLEVAIRLTSSRENPPRIMGLQ